MSCFLCCTPPAGGSAVTSWRASCQRFPITSSSSRVMSGRRRVIQPNLRRSSLSLNRTNPRQKTPRSDAYLQAEVSLSVCFSSSERTRSMASVLSIEACNMVVPPLTSFAHSELRTVPNSTQAKTGKLTAMKIAADSHIGEIVDQVPRAALVLEILGIDFCANDQRALSAAAAAAGCDLDEVMGLLNRRPLPARAASKGKSVAEMTSFIAQGHH